jgi:hypothetical protein
VEGRENLTVADLFGHDEMGSSVENAPVVGEGLGNCIDWTKY